MPIWLVLIMIEILLCLVFIPLMNEWERMKEKRKEYLRESFSPMSEDAETQEAYDDVR